MKDNRIILRQVALLLTVWVVSLGNLRGQTYKPGDLYTFEDGSVGIVFYVNPDDPGSGTVAALNDLEGQYALWTGSVPPTLSDVFAPNGGVFFNQIKGWENHGKRFTQVLWESGVSPAANAIDVAAGWYIPDLLQLHKLYSSTALLKDAFENHGGDIMSMWSKVHWSASRTGKLSNTVYSIQNSLKMNNSYGTQSYYIRPVRDFPDTAEVYAFWVENAPYSDTVVAPNVTSSYNAFVIYRSDTLSLTATVTVHQPVADTLYETVYNSTSPYTSAVEPLFSNLNISLPGNYEYRDTILSSNGCDSVIVLMLTVSDNVRYTDTLCSLKADYYFAPFDTVFAVGTVSGVFEHHGSKLVDGVEVDTVAFYDLTVLPDYQQFDTVTWCLYEDAETRLYAGNVHVSIAVNGASVTVVSDTDAVVVEEVASGADYNLKMQTVSGCDSVTHLHLDLRRVARDTVYKDMLLTQLVGGEATVACHAFTGITIPGTYSATDTLVATNGCDSIMTVFLLVEPLHTETLCDSVLASNLTWTSNLDGYVWNGLPLSATVGESGYYEFLGQKTIDGKQVDTVSYLQLIVNQKYEGKDTASFCLYEPTFNTAYDLNSAVTVMVDASDGITVISSDAEVEVLAVPGSVTDFALKMQTVSGCDSVVFLYVDVRRVSRDTIRHHAYMHQIESERITVDGREFTGITGAGTYELRDTLVAVNGCDSIVVYTLTVEACISGFSIVCPPDVYDTLAYGDCAMSIGPDRIGSATVQYDVAWPFIIGNDIPADSLFAQGDNVITWTATDPECGGSVLCEQHVFIAFPQCPDAEDFEGNVYHGVRVGCDCWTQRNLESTRYSDGTDISGRYAYANAQHPDTAANVAVFGRLYSYEAAVYDSADNGHGHIQGVCPVGWYLPTPEKYEDLNAYGADALRSPDYWIIGAGNNSTGFTALPAGFYNGEFNRYEGLLSETYFWSTKGVLQATSKSIYSITYYCDYVLKQHSQSGLGFSVRCVKEK